jgi:hypothetical protein
VRYLIRLEPRKLSILFRRWIPSGDRNQSLRRDLEIESLPYSAEPQRSLAWRGRAKTGPASTDTRTALSGLIPLNQERICEVDLAGLFEKELEALRGVERAKGGAGNGESVEIRSRLDPQRGELSWHGQNIGRVVELEIGREWQNPPMEP